MSASSTRAVVQAVAERAEGGHAQQAPRRMEQQKLDLPAAWAVRPAASKSGERPGAVLAAAASEAVRESLPLLGAESIGAGAGLARQDVEAMAKGERHVQGRVLVHLLRDESSLPLMARWIERVVAATGRWIAKVTIRRRAARTRPVSPAEYHQQCAAWLRAHGLEPHARGDIASWLGCDEDELQVLAALAQEQRLGEAG